MHASSGIRRLSVSSGLRVSLIGYGLSRAITLAIAALIAARQGPGDFVGVLARWDGQFFLNIAGHGYISAEGTTAFLPGYPLTMRAVAKASPLSLPWAGVAISLFAGAVAVLIIWYFVCALTDEGTATRTALLFSFFPSSFVLSMVYSEGLFVMFAAACLFALYRQRWLVGGLAAAAAGAVRPAGLVLALCCAWAAGSAIALEGRWRALIAVALAPLGALGYFLYLRLHTGDWLAFVHAEQRGWKQTFDFGISNVREVVNLAEHPRFDVYLGLLAMASIGTVISLYLMAKWRPPVIVWIYSLGILALTFMITTTTSVPRFLLAAFPLLIGVALYAKKWTMPIVLLFGVAMAVLEYALVGAVVIVNGRPLPP